MLRPALMALFLLAAPTVRAEVPHVAVDIAPVQSLVAQVMGDLGTPDLVVSPGASPHGYALRPSQAAALERADLVIWMGPALTPWLAGSLATLAPDARHVALLDAPQTVIFEARDGADFSAQNHDHDHDHTLDPHAWLDPENARAWVQMIAEDLATLDPENATTYRGNAEAAGAALADLIAEIRTELAPLTGTRFIVFHDAYQYFETRFDLAAIGAISLSDASAPGAARIAEIRAALAAQDVACVFAEPQFNAGLVAAVLEGSPARTGVIDPIGADIPPGPEFYATLIRTMAAGIAACLSGG